MGLYFRKSVRAGPFRFNFSGRGIGVSTGIPGFRIGSAYLSDIDHFPNP